MLRVPEGWKPTFPRGRKKMLRMMRIHPWQAVSHMLLCALDYSDAQLNSQTNVLVGLRGIHESREWRPNRFWLDSNLWLVSTACLQAGVLLRQWSKPESKYQAAPAHPQVEGGTDAQCAESSACLTEEAERAAGKPLITEEVEEVICIQCQNIISRTPVVKRAVRRRGGRAQRPLHRAWWEVNWYFVSGCYACSIQLSE